MQVSVQLFLAIVALFAFLSPTSGEVRAAEGRASTPTPVPAQRPEPSVAGAASDPEEESASQQRQFLDPPQLPINGRFGNLAGCAQKSYSDSMRYLTAQGIGAWESFCPFREVEFISESDGRHGSRIWRVEGVCFAEGGAYPLVATIQIREYTAFVAELSKRSYTLERCG